VNDRRSLISPLRLRASMDQALLAEAAELEAAAEAAANAATVAEAEAAAATADAHSTTAQVEDELRFSQEQADDTRESALPDDTREPGLFGLGSSTWSGFTGSSLSGLQAKLKSAASEASGAIKAAATDAGGAIKAASSEAAKAAAAAAKAAAASASGDSVLRTTALEFLLISGEQAPAGASSEALSRLLRARGLQLVRGCHFANARQRPTWYTVQSVCTLAFTRYCFTSRLLCTNQPSFYCTLPPALPTLLQYDCTTITQYTTRPRLFLCILFTIRYW